VAASDQPGAAYVVRLTAADVGARVVVRRRLDDGGLGDLLGELEQWDESAVVVRDRHGARHVVRPGDVVAGKRVPPAPARRP